MTATTRQLTGRALTALLVFALAACVWQGWRWWSTSRAGQAADATVSADRDAAAVAAERGMVAFNTTDYRTPEDTVDRWAGASTGGLLDEVHRQRQKVATSIADGKTVTTARSIQSGFTAYDSAAGRATVIAVVEVRSTPEAAPSSATRVRLAGDVTRTADGWRLSSIQTLPAR